MRALAGLEYMETEKKGVHTCSQAWIKLNGMCEDQ